MADGRNSDVTTLDAVDVERYIDWIALQHVSNGLYQGHIEQSAREQNASATNVLNAVEKLEAYLGYWKDCIGVIARRSQFGISALFKIIPDAAPIVAKRLTYSVADCAITGLKSRPCFVIISTKNAQPLLTAHHSVLNQCQLVWAFFHMRSVIETAVAECMSGDIKPRLSAACAQWTESTARQKTIRFFCTVFSNMPQVIRGDNNLTVLPQIS